MNSPSLDYEKLEEAVRYDPGLTANILRLANSALFGVKRPVDSLHMAFVVLGEKKLFELVMAHISLRMFDVELQGYQHERQDFMRHSVWVGIAAEQFAQTLGIKTEETLFTAGLLHDIGKLVLDPFLLQEPEEMQASDVESTSESFDKREERVLGINHNEAGAILLEHWNLPSEIYAAVRFHHAPDCATAHKQLIEIVHVSDMLAYAQSVGTGVKGVHYDLSEEALVHLNLQAETVEYVASQTVDEMKEVLDLLE